MLEQKAVQLSLRQRIGALLLDGVLGRHHRKAGAERVGDAVDRHLPLLHGLQQGRLGLGRRAVDLVGQQQLAEHRTARQGEGRGLEVEQIGPDHVAGRQVGGELDAAIVEGDAAGEALGQQCLGRPGRTFEQHVAAGEQGHQQQVHRLVLTDDGLGDLGPDPPGQHAHVTDVHPIAVHG